MHLKKLVLLCLAIQYTEVVYCLNMDDVCSADDNTCKKPNLSGVGMIEKGKCSLTGVLLRFHQLSMLECAKKCFITSQCTSINYRQNWKLCDLVMSNDDGNEIADDSTCIRSNITTWQKSLGGKCTGHNCEEGQKCEFYADNNGLKCVEAYCKGLPNTPNAKVDERFGLRRNLDTGNKYKCDKDYEMEGNPFAVCQSPGHWKVLFTCTKVVCSVHGYTYDKATNTCIKLVITDGSTWINARSTCKNEGGDLVSITTMEKWSFVIRYLGDNRRNVWIGLRDTKWMTGEYINSIFDDISKLNSYDSLYKNEADNTCGVIYNLPIPLQDANCNIRKYKWFLCELLIPLN